MFTCGGTYFKRFGEFIRSSQKMNPCVEKRGAGPEVFLHRRRVCVTDLCLAIMFTQTVCLREHDCQGIDKYNMAGSILHWFQKATLHY